MKDKGKTIKDQVAETMRLLRRHLTPTEIGSHLGKPYELASSSVTPALKELVRENMVERIEISNRKVLYKWIGKEEIVLSASSIECLLDGGAVHTNRVIISATKECHGLVLVKETKAKQ